MAELPPTALPPKLDLRKNLAAKDAAPQVTPVAAPVTPAAVPATPAAAPVTPAAAKPVTVVAAKPVVVSTDQEKPGVRIIQPAAPKEAPASTPSVSPLKPAPPVEETASPLAAKPTPTVRPVAVTAASAPATAQPVAAAKPLAAKVLDPKIVSTQTQILQIAPPVEPAAGGAPKPGVLQSKKETSRIPLESVMTVKPGAAGAPGAGPKTIHIKPSTGPGPMKPTMGGIKTIAAAPVAAPGAAAQAHPSPGAPSAASDEKRKTSRISLEAALASSDKTEAAGGGDGGGPKTIKLKRPGEAPTVKAKSTAGSEMMATVMGKTARLDEPAAAEAADDSEEGPSGTQRRTVRIKRPGESSASAAVSVGGPGAGAGAEEKPRAAVSAAPRAEKVNVVFPIFSIAAMLVLFVLIYVLMAEVFGPNVSLTQLSYGSPGLNLSWPEKIPSH